jgi:hypothetical protein
MDASFIAHLSVVSEARNEGIGVVVRDGRE